MKILIADDDLSSRNILSAAVAEIGYEAIVVSNGQAVLKHLKSCDSAVILLDWMMPGTDGIEVCRRIREMDADGSFYIIMRSSREESRDVSRALSAGANDYIFKMTDPMELKARLGVGIRTVQLETQLIELNHRLQRLARMDSLTELLNHAAILKELDLELDRGRRERSSTSVLMLDLDNFKAINDTYGHQTGDRVLVKLSKLLKDKCRSFDRIGRYGGEEFLLVLPRTGTSDATSIGNRIRIALSDLNMDDIVEELRITCSIGACSATESLQHSSALVAAADAALFRAKRAGRNIVMPCGRKNSTEEYRQT